MATPSNQEPPLLLKPRDEVAAELSDRIEAGQALADRPIGTPQELKTARDEYYTWSDYNAELLRRRFSNDRFYLDYRGGPRVAFVGGLSSFQEDYSDHLKDVRGKVRRLKSILERLDLVDEAPDVSDMPARRRLDGTSVFVVHGHDEGARESVARFLEKLGLEVVILHEKANKGMTLIEKFEEHAQKAGYAVVLLTPDDVGKSARDSGEPKPRARQNVIFEAGFFYAQLGRHRVAMLYSEGVEQPSDVDGIAWIGLDRQSWKLELAKELREAGFPIDMNRI